MTTLPTPVDIRVTLGELQFFGRIIKVFEAEGYHNLNEAIHILNKHPEILEKGIENICVEMQMLKRGNISIQEENTELAESSQVIGKICIEHDYDGPSC